VGGRGYQIRTTPGTTGQPPVVLLVPVGLLLVRATGFSPTTQTYTALETIAANLCWVPPLVGAWTERTRRERTGSE
jgi:hypothetical protein